MAYVGVAALKQRDYQFWMIERGKYALFLKEKHYKYTQVSDYSQPDSKKFRERLIHQGTLCLGCGIRLKVCNPKRNAEKCGQGQMCSYCTRKPINLKDETWRCLSCKLPIACGPSCVNEAEWMHQHWCLFVEGQAITELHADTPEMFKEAVVKKLIERKVIAIKKNYKQDVLFDYHPYVDDDYPKYECICYGCEKVLEGGVPPVVCDFCRFGSWCSEDCRDKTKDGAHFLCAPFCHNPACKRIAFRMFCCSKAVYCSSRCFHIDLQFNRSRHDCNPCPQFFVFYHRPLDMAKVTDKYFHVLDRLKKCNGKLFEVMPTEKELVQMKIQCAELVQPMLEGYHSELIWRLKKVTNLDYLLTQKAVFQFKIPNLLFWFYHSVVKFTCRFDYIAVLAFQDVWHMMTCKGCIVLTEPWSKSNGFLLMANKVLYETKEENGACYCGACSDYKFNFDFLLWVSLGYGAPFGRIPPPLEGLLIFLWFHALQYQCLGVDSETSYIVHSFIPGLLETVKKEEFEREQKEKAEKQEKSAQKSSDEDYDIRLDLLKAWFLQRFEQFENSDVDD